VGGDKQGGPPTLAVRDLPAGQLVPAIVGALRAYTHFVVLEGWPPSEDRRPMADIMTAVAALPGTGSAAAERPGKLSFTRVQIDPDEAGKTGAVTRYSRTHQPLPPHTDTAYSPRPHSLVAFQMVRSDAEGGRSTVLPVAEVVEALDPDSLTAMRQPHFAFGKGDLPILWGRPGAESMRYYRAQIEQAAALRGTVPSHPVAVLDKIDAVLERLDPRRFALADGEVLVINNHKVLHGRTGMAADSKRLMFRFRAHAAVIE
jgi:alpha-ketoglutarate-dependent taurine dioxygenase